MYMQTLQGLGYDYATQPGGIGLEEYYKRIFEGSQSLGPSELAAQMDEYDITPEDVVNAYQKFSPGTGLTLNDVLEAYKVGGGTKFLPAAGGSVIVDLSAAEEAQAIAEAEERARREAEQAAAEAIAAAEAEAERIRIEAANERDRLRREAEAQAAAQAAANVAALAAAQAAAAQAAEAAAMAQAKADADLAAARTAAEQAAAAASKAQADAAAAVAKAAADAAAAAKTVVTNQTQVDTTQPTATGGNAGLLLAAGLAALTLLG